MSVISLFTGAGGLDLGFEYYGFNPAVCVDNDPESCKTLRANTNWPVYEGEIEAFECEGHVEGVIGGPPCQGFSTAGKANPEDPRNFLWKEYFRIVESADPDFIVIENVPGMLYKRNKNNLDELIDALRSRGFVIHFDVLDAADYGVPQHRERLIIVGGQGFEIPLPEPTVERHVTVREAIEDLEEDYEALNHVRNKHAPHVVERWNKLEAGETDPNYRRAKLNPDRPSTTIRAGGGYGPKGDHLAGFHPPIHYRFPRQLTVREAARIQGFPDYWEFKGSKTVQGRQVGNAVAPPVAKALAEQVRSALDAHREGQRREDGRCGDFEWWAGRQEPLSGLA